MVKFHSKKTRRYKHRPGDKALPNQLEERVVKFLLSRWTYDSFERKTNDVVGLLFLLRE